ncbi:MAG: 4-(cytidine 5'-diphospho)-2-C-methyl-D-erythritol kinase [Atopobiaceae bacterium]|nr:4-(cytidine 5'-diphospho)-2-C-methyl-D-erythritol kinase [Atopobiaceae bacterium]MCI2173889.1 4-(cytidine 5'-diphospho)-2-C-methyl-D-erythritol kinase [Atopobiaceae bacterium]MCI2208021.1 4-(cytidine 5'-diphospho)-2-C-methyl-D-erythritol kinase [Atopobiaceae bacterium]
MTNTTVTLLAPAKVNLYLGVRDELDERRYHRVDSVMSTVGLYDEVSVTPSGSLSVTCVPEAGCAEDENSCWKAAVAMGEAFGREPSVSISVTRGIPAKSGLGGASTDAAAAILAICRLWDVDVSDARLPEVARSVGADVPFFLYAPLALLEGAGDVLSERLPSLAGLPIVLVRPEGGGISAAEAYGEFDRMPSRPEDREPLLAALRAHDVAAVPSLLSNNLDPVARRLEPVLDEVRSWLMRRNGVRAVLVTGSGSCTYAVCDGSGPAEAVADAAREQGWWACATTLLDKGPEVVDL